MKRVWMSDYNGIVAYIHFNTSVRRQKIYKYFLGHNVDFKILGIKWKCIAFLSKKKKKKFRAVKATWAWSTNVWKSEAVST